MLLRKGQAICGPSSRTREEKKQEDRKQKESEPGREPKIFCRLQLGSNVSRRNAKETES